MKIWETEKQKRKLHQVDIRYNLIRLDCRFSKNTKPGHERQKHQEKDVDKNQAEGFDREYRLLKL